MNPDFLTKLIPDPGRLLKSSKAQIGAGVIWFLNYLMNTNELRVEYVALGSVIIALSYMFANAKEDGEKALAKTLVDEIK